VCQDEYTLNIVHLKNTCNDVKTMPTYAVGWVPYLADWKNYLKKYNLFSALQYHDPSKLDGVGVLIGVYNGKLYGCQLKTRMSEELKTYKPGEGHYSWALVPGGSIMYVWNSQLQLNDRDYTQHSDLNENKPVVCAGEFMFSSSQPFVFLNTIHIELNDASGHYKPDGAKCFSFILDAFKDLKLDTSEVKVFTQKH